MNKFLDKITREIYEVVNDNFPDYGPTKKEYVDVDVDVNEMFSDNLHEIAPTREDKGEYRDYFEYGDYSKGNIKYAENGMQRRDSPTSNVIFESVALTEF